MSRWIQVHSSHRVALAIVDGRGAFEGHGPHYSRRTRDAVLFTGIGKEIVLVTECGRAVWACVYAKTPPLRGTGRDSGVVDPKPRYLWRNNMFRNLGAGLSSELIAAAVRTTYAKWIERYGSLPQERLRTEVDVRKVASRNPGYCYTRAGWEKGERVGSKLHLWAPERASL